MPVPNLLRGKVGWQLGTVVKILHGMPGFEFDSCPFG